MPLPSRSQQSDQLELLSQEDQREIEEVRAKIVEHQQLIDKFRYRMLQITSELQSLNTQKIEKSLECQKEVEELSKIHKNEMEDIKTRNENKIHEHLRQIEALLKEKAEFNQQLQIFQA